MAGIYSQGGSAGHRYAGRLSEVEAKNFAQGGKVFNGSPSAIYLGSKLVWWKSWLDATAQARIIEVFGQRDGKAVIKATDDYLNGLGKQKATVLASYINEDPMMVCSLGLEPQGVTMPKRELIGNGGVWFDTGITSEYRQMSYEIEAAATRTLSGSDQYWILGNYGGSGQGFCAGIYQTNKAFIYAKGGNSNVTVNDITAYHTYKFVIDADQGLFSTDCDGTYANVSKPYNNYARNETIKFLDGQPAYLNKGYYKFRQFDMRYGDNGHIHFIPFKHKDGDNVIPCVLDIEGCQLYYNQGTGTPTIPDISYTPSTPEPPTFTHRKSAHFLIEKLYLFYRKNCTLR